MSKDLGIIKRMLAYIDKYKWIYIISLIGGGLCGGIRGALFTLLFKNSFDASADKNSSTYNNITLLVVSLLFISLLQRLFTFLFKYCNRNITLNIRINAFSKLDRIALSEFENNHSGKIISCLNNDIQAMEEAYSSKMSSLINTLCSGSISICIIFILDYRIALLSIVINIVCTIINTRFIPLFRKNSKDILESASKMLTILSNTLIGNRNIKMFAIDSEIQNEFNIINKFYGKNITKQFKANGLLNGVDMLLQSINFIGILSVGLYFIFSGSTTIGTVVGIILLQDGIGFMFMSLGDFVNQLQHALSGAERVFKLLDLIEEPHKSKISSYTSDNYYSNAYIEFRNVNFSYVDKKIIDNINLKVNKNSVIGVIGKSGSGKSTLLKLLMSFYSVDSGEIYISNKNINSYTLSELRQKIAYVSQYTYLFFGTIKENISYGYPATDISKEMIINAAKNANAHDFIMRLPKDYDTIVGENGIQLSGGERQRIAIARAFIKNCPILLLDEATSSLDTKSEMIIQQALLTLMKGRTVLIVAHKLSTIDNLDLICVMNEGKIIEQGPQQELFNKDSLYKQFYNI